MKNISHGCNCKLIYSGTPLNPLGPISIQLKKEKCLYKVLTPSIISYI